jgi:hypothetical protein
VRHRYLLLLVFLIASAMSAADRPISTLAVGPSRDVIPAPRLARLDDGFLAIWREGTQCAPQELHGIRLDPDGQPLDSSSFVLAQTLTNPGVIDVAADGHDAYVIWPSFAFGSYFARVRADGTVRILSSSIQVAGSASALRISDDNILIVGTQKQLGDPLTATLVDPSGEVIRNDVTLVSTAHVREWDLIPSNGGFLFGWIGDDGLHVTNISPADLAANTVPAAPLVLSTTSILHPSLASDGVHSMVSWFDLGKNALRMLSLSPAATPVGDPITIGSVAPIEAPAVVAVGAGYEFLVRDATNPGDSQLVALFISFEGSLLALHRYPSITVQPEMAQDGDQTIAIWTEKRFATSKGTEVIAGSIGTDGSVSAGAIISLSSVEQHVRKFVPFAGGVAALWTDNVPNDLAMVGRFTAAGEPLDGAGIHLHDTSFDQTHSAMATDGERLFVVWMEGESSASRALYGAIVSFNDSPSVSVQQLASDASAASDLAVTWNGQTFTIVYQRVRTNSFDFAALRVDRAGNVVDPAPIALTPAGLNDENPRLSWSGSDYLLVWQRSYNPINHVVDPCSDPLPSELFAQRFSAALVPNSAVIDLATTTDRLDYLLDVRDVDVSFAGGVWLVIWRDNQSNLSMYARIDASGSPLDPLNGRQLPDFLEHPLLVPAAPSTPASNNGWTVAGLEGNGPYGNGRGLAIVRVGTDGQATALPTLPFSGISSVEAVALTPVPLVAFKRSFSVSAYIGLVAPPRSHAVRH